MQALLSIMMLHICMHTQIITAFNKQKDYIQSPPTGCPRQIYKLMVECWYVSCM